MIVAVFFVLVGCVVALHLVARRDRRELERQAATHRIIEHLKGQP